MTRKLAEVRKSLYAIVQDSVESGTRTLISWDDLHKKGEDTIAFWRSKDCGCLLWVVAGDSYGMHGIAANKLGITDDEVSTLEAGFESFGDRRWDKNSSFYKLGAEIRQMYCEYPNQGAQ